MAVVLLVLLVGGGLVWLLGFSSAFDVRAVQVQGGSDETRAAVRAAAPVPAGHSLVWLDTSEVAARVASVPAVAAVDVGRSLPGTVTVAVTERVPVVGVPGPGGLALVDATGVAYRTMSDAPAVPHLVLPPGVAPHPGEPSTAAALRVVGALPPDLRRQLAEVRAAGPYAVEFTLADGRVVRWGADADDARKAAVLGPLLARPGHLYDVSSPELAVVS